MFGLRPIYVKSPNETVGWMSGFSWTRKQAIDYRYFEQYWHGPAHEQCEIFRILHFEIQKTKDLPEHRCFDLFKFITSNILLIGIILLVIGVTGDNVGLFIIGAVIAFLSLVLILFTRVILFCNMRSLRKKISQSIERCNIVLRKYGYYAKFPLISKNFLFCIPCSDCYTKQNYNLIEIYDENNSRKKVIDINYSAQPMAKFNGKGTNGLNGMQTEMKETIQ